MTSSKRLTKFVTSASVITYPSKHPLVSETAANSPLCPVVSRRGGGPFQVARPPLARAGRHLKRRSAMAYPYKRDEKCGRYHIGPINPGGSICYGCGKQMRMDQLSEYLYTHAKVLGMMVDAVGAAKRFKNQKSK